MLLLQHWKGPRGLSVRPIKHYFKEERPISPKIVISCNLSQLLMTLIAISVISVETFYSNTAFSNDFGYLLLKYPLPPFFNVEIQISLPVLLLQHWKGPRGLSVRPIKHYFKEERPISPKIVISCNLSQLLMTLIVGHFFVQFLRMAGQNVAKCGDGRKKGMVSCCIIPF